MAIKIKGQRRNDGGLEEFFDVDAARKTEVGNLADLTTKNKSNVVAAINEAAKSGGGGMTDAVKSALLTIAEKTSYSDTHGQDYYDALYVALYPPATLIEISAAFNQGNHVVYDNDSIDILRQWLVVTATYDDGHTETITQYSLRGVLAEGNSTITVLYEGKSATFVVSVTHKDVVVTSLSAVFEQGNHTIYDNMSVDSLRPYLTVTATYDDGKSNIVSAYSLSGSLAVGTSTITASFGGESDTFTVVVTQHPKEAVSISAVFNQGSNVVYDTSSLDSLRPYLTVTATYDDGTSGNVSDYLLGGTLTAGTSNVNVYYNNLNTSFTVNVTHYAPEDVSVTWVNGSYNSETNDFAPSSAYAGRLGMTEILYDRGFGFDFSLPTPDASDETVYFNDNVTQVNLAILVYDENGTHIGQLNPQTMAFTENPTSWDHTLVDIGTTYHIPTGYGVRLWVTQSTGWVSNAIMKKYMTTYVTSVTR